MIIRMNWRLTPKRSAGQLTTTVRNHLVHVHVELSSTSSHPHVERKHIVVLTRENFLTYLDDQLMARLIEASVVKVSIAVAFLRMAYALIISDRNQVPTDAKMLERTLRLCAPEFICRYVYLA